ncbi:MAG TPA: sigma-70 family RNA polymerase sigma factor, partial [Bacteroidales bacterium]|nr:sigma-70 family RNA polymerase sigma factor [Bacteroidales bacterium]
RLILLNRVAENAELLERILEAIHGLPDQCQKVFKLSRFQHLKYAEIAKELNISVKTVEAHISKALKLLQAHLRSTIILLIIVTAFLFL